MQSTLATGDLHIQLIHGSQPGLYLQRASWNARASAAARSAIKKNGVPVSAFDAATEMFSLVGKISKQFLLEYTTTGGPGWIHIAYADGTLKSAMPYGTLKDHATYARNQLVNLKPSAVA